MARNMQFFKHKLLLQLTILTQLSPHFNSVLVYNEQLLKHHKYDYF